MADDAEDAAKGAVEDAEDAGKDAMGEMPGGEMEDDAAK